MSMQAYIGLIRAFGRSGGLPEVICGTDCRSTISFDDIDVQVHYVPSDDTLVLLAYLGSARADQSDPTAALFGSTNTFWPGTRCCTLGMSQDTRNVFLSDHCALSRLDDMTFSIWLGSFMDAALHWQWRLADLCDAPVPTPQASAPLLFTTKARSEAQPSAKA